MPLIDRGAHLHSAVVPTGVPLRDAPQVTRPSSHCDRTVHLKPVKYELLGRYQLSPQIFGTDPTCYRNDLMGGEGGLELASGDHRATEMVDAAADAFSTLFPGYQNEFTSGLASVIDSQTVRPIENFQAVQCFRTPSCE